MYEFGVCGCDHFLKLFLLLLDDALFSVGFAHDDELFRGEICNCTMLRDPLAVHWLFGLEKLLNDWHELLFFYFICADFSHVDALRLSGLKLLVISFQIVTD